MLKVEVITFHNSLFIIHILVVMLVTTEAGSVGS
jgi:hypothetical protein